MDNKSKKSSANSAAKNSLGTKTKPEKQGKATPATQSKQSPQRLQKPKKTKKTKVIFVCTGNTCRSPMAEQLFKDFLRRSKILSAFDIKSAGLYADAGARLNDYARISLEELGIKVAAHTSRQLCETMAEGAHLIVCMTAGHKAQIEGHPYIFSIGELTGGGDVPDPYGGDLSRYQAVAKYLQYACEDIFKVAKNAQDFCKK